MRSWLIAPLMVTAFVCCVDARAQDDSCPVTIIDRDVSLGRRIEIRYQLRSPQGSEFCDVLLTIRLDGKDIPIRSDGRDAPLDGKESGCNAIGTGPVPVDGSNKLVIAICDRDITSATPNLNAVAVPPPPPPPLQWHAGASWFWSLESRKQTPALGWQQASGGVIRLGLPLKRVFELGVEAALTAREALDSELFAASAERRYYRDSTFSAILARPLPIGQRVAIVPLGGGGVAALETFRYTYSPSSFVLTGSERRFRVAPVATVGVDLRFRLTTRLQLVVQERLHILGGATDEIERRPTLHHRPAIGFQVNFGGRP